MTKVSLILLILVFSTLFYIGAVLYYEMAIELEEHPEIKEIGGPPVFTDLRLVFLITVIAVILCGILLKYNRDENRREQ
jgi:hypothetical protein